MRATTAGVVFVALYWIRYDQIGSYFVCGGILISWSTDVANEESRWNFDYYGVSLMFVRSLSYYLDFSDTQELRYGGEI